MQRVLVALAMVLGLVTSANAQVSVGIGIRGSGLSIGINFSSYPHLVPVPGYPVYYYPEGNSNYFFYDGLYWVYEDDNWYASSWYNGPWDLIDPYYVPVFVLRIPVRYYHQPPVYFRGWAANAPPRWHERWGRAWNSRRSGWDQWDRRSAPRPAPLPSYQSQYSGNRYPRAPEQQHSIRSDKYRYQPHESVTQRYWQQQKTQRPQTEPRAKGREGAPATQEKGQQKDAGPGQRGRDEKDKEHDQGPR